MPESEGARGVFPAAYAVHYAQRAFALCLMPKYGNILKKFSKVLEITHDYMVYLF